MADSVYKVIELVGTSTVSWEKAATAAVELAAKSLRDLRVAEIVQLDMTIDEGKVQAYRAKVSFWASWSTESSKTNASPIFHSRRSFPTRNQAGPGSSSGRWTIDRTFDDPTCGGMWECGASEEKNEAVTEKPAVMEKKAEIKIEPKPIQKPSVIADSRPVNGVTAAPAPNPVAVTTNYDVINLRASAESWAEVQDANDHRLFYSLMKSGDSHVIKGRAPFKVFLGNAPSVSVDVNNQAVNISRYIRQNNIAHVKITSQAGTQSGGPRENINQVIDQYVPETCGTSTIE